MVGSVYPNAIDGPSQIPILIDGVSPVRARDINCIRDAVIAIETELGINPSGTFGTVRARLDALDALLNSLGDGYGASILVDSTAGLVETPANKAYTLRLNIPFDGFIDCVYTQAVSGTCTLTTSINGVPLGGGPNSVSSSQDVVSHTSDNVFVAGDELAITVSSNVATTDMNFEIIHVRTP